MTKTLKNNMDAEIHVDSYKIVWCDSNGRYTGGAIIFLHETIEVKEIYKIGIPRKLWCLFVKAKKNY